MNRLDPHSLVREAPTEQQGNRHSQVRIYNYTCHIPSLLWSYINDFHAVVRVIESCRLLFCALADGDVGLYGLLASC